MPGKKICLLFYFEIQAEVVRFLRGRNTETLTEYRLLLLIIPIIMVVPSYLTRSLLC